MVELVPGDKHKPMKCVVGIKLGERLYRTSDRGVSILI